MSEFYIVGRNDQTNKSSVLNIDDNGKLKLDETGFITNIKNNTGSTVTKLTEANAHLTSINSDVSLLELDYVQRRINLQYERSLGNCFVSFFDEKLTSDTFYFMSFTNPNGSGKTMYIYSININVSDHTATNIGGNIKMVYYPYSNYSGSGTTIAARNLKIGSSNNSVLFVRKQPNISGSTDFMKDSFSLSTDTTMELFQVYHNMVNDMIEVPPGWGFAFSFQDDTGATLDMDVSANVRWLEK